MNNATDTQMQKAIEPSDETITDQLNNDGASAQQVRPNEEVAAAEVCSSETTTTSDDEYKRALDQLRDDVRRIEGICESVQSRLGSLETATTETSKQISFLPPQVRQLGAKVESLNSSISEPRYKAVLLGLLGVYDLVDQLLHTRPANETLVTEADHQRNYEVVRTQLRQLLEGNGLVQIPTDGAFDPTMHRATQRTTVGDPSQADMILEVVRPGFRTEQSVLRYAEVVVGHYTPENSETEESVDEESKGAT